MDFFDGYVLFFVYLYYFLESLYYLSGGTIESFTQLS